MSELKTHTTLNVIGDWWCDSLGFSAKYGIYSFRDQQSNKIINFTLTNVDCVANSVVMKKLALLHCLKKWKRRMALTLS